MMRLAFWEARSRRDRVLIASAGAVLAVLLVIALVWLPMERHRARLSQDLPRLRASIAALQRDADEAKRLRSLPAIASAKGTPLSSLAASTLAGAQVTVLDDRRVRVSGADVGYAALLDWIAAAQAAHGLRVDTARFEALPTVGRVRVELMLARTSP